MIRVRTVLDTGAGPNLIHYDRIDPAWRTSIRDTTTPSLRDASKRAMRTLGVITLLVRIGQFQAHVQFLVVPNLAVDCILGTTFTDRHVKAIYPRSQTVHFHDAPPVALVGSTSPTAPASAPHDLAQETPSRKLRLARAIVIPPMTQMPATVTAASGGLCFLQNHPRMAHKHLALMAQGVMDLLPNTPFTVLVSNFGIHPVRLPKNNVLGLALPAPAHIFTFDTTHGAPDLKKWEIIAEPTDTPPDAPETPKDWTNEVKVGVTNAATKEAVLDMLQDFKAMWDGRLGTISATKHRIEVTKGTAPVYQAPYRAGHKARTYEEMEIKRMLDAKVIEPSSAEWASPVVLVPKKDKTLSSASTTAV